MLVQAQFSISNLLLIILVVWRFSRFICFENGPFGILIAVRKIFYRLKIEKVIECFHCFAVWSAMLFCVLYFRFTIELIFLILASSGGASIIQFILESFNNSNYQEIE